MVHIPDDPLYLYEFLDAYEYFGKWVAWERDADHNGSLAAASWRDAIEKTRQTLLTGCGNIIGDDEMSDILDKLDEISERLKELEDMDVIVNQTVNGCGCSDGSTPTTTTTTTVTNPTIDPTDTGLEPPYDNTVYTVVNAVKCRTANWLADTIITAIRGLANIGMQEMVIVIVLGVVGQIVSALDGVPLNGIFWGVALISIAQAIVQLSSLDDFELIELETLADEIESMKEEFVCVLYGWTTASELSSALLGFLYSRVDETATAEGWDTDAVEFIKSIFDKLFGSRLSNHIVQNAGSIVPADFTAQYDCLCGATGDSCPAQNLVLAGIGSLPSIAGDLSGTTQGFASEFNSKTGYHEIVFELDANYCVSIDNGAYTPTESHEKCANDVMVASDGSCIRRFTARSLSPFATAVEFKSQTTNCDCPIIPDDATIQLIDAPITTITYLPDAGLSDVIAADLLSATISVNKADGRWGSDSELAYDLSVIPSGWQVVGMLHEITGSSTNAIDEWQFISLWGNETTGVDVGNPSNEKALGYDTFNNVDARIQDIVSAVDYAVSSFVSVGVRGNCALRSFRTDNNVTGVRSGSFSIRSLFLISTV